MGDVDVQVQFTTTKTRKVKKTTKRRESKDGSEVTVTEIEQSNNVTGNDGYVLVPRDLVSFFAIWLSDVFKSCL